MKMKKTKKKQNCFMQSDLHFSLPFPQSNDYFALS